MSDKKLTAEEFNTIALLTTLTTFMLVLKQHEDTDLPNTVTTQISAVLSTCHILGENLDGLCSEFSED